MTSAKIQLVSGDGSTEVPVDPVVEIYRDPDRGQEVVADTGDGTVPLGVADITVSRKKGESPPVEIRKEGGEVQVRNRGNSNGLTVEKEGTESDVPEGGMRVVRETATVTVGYQTELRVAVSTGMTVDTYVEQQHNVDQSTVVEDVVMQDSTVRTGGAPAETADGEPVDASGETEVRDAVLNRSEVGGGDDATVEDAVVNRSSVGSGDAGGADQGSDGAVAGSPGPEGADPAPDDDGATVETADLPNYCPGCGNEVSERGPYCSSCGQHLV